MKTIGNLVWFVLALALLPGCRRGGADALVSRESGGLVLADRDLLICNDCQETDYYYCFHLKK